MRHLNEVDPENRDRGLLFRSTVFDMDISISLCPKYRTVSYRYHLFSTIIDFFLTKVFKSSYVQSVEITLHWASMDTADILGSYSQFQAAHEPVKTHMRAALLHDGDIVHTDNSMICSFVGYFLMVRGHVDRLGITCRGWRFFSFSEGARYFAALQICYFLVRNNVLYSEIFFFYGRCPLLCPFG